MKKYAFFTDIHGCYHTFLECLKKVPADHEVIILGDLVDRGPSSRKLLDFVIQKGYRCVMGNHDHMMADYAQYLESGVTDYNDNIWFSNGAIHTVRDYGCDDMRFDQVIQKLKASDTFRKHADWLAQLPIFIVEEDILMSHTGHANIADDPDITLMDQIWARGYSFPADQHFRVFGHTSNQEPIVKRTYVNLDTGAAYGSHGMGNLTCFLWPEKTFIRQPYHEPMNPKDYDL